MLSGVRALLLGVSLVVVAGGASAQITVYDQPNFKGKSLKITENNWSSGGGGAAWNDNIQSIKVPQGWTVKVYEHNKDRGKFETLTADMAQVPAGFGISNIEIVSSPSHGCYYQEQKDNSKWTKNGGFAKDVKTVDQCIALDGCFKGGGNKSSGGCYVYASSPAVAAEMLKSSGRK